MSTPMWIRSRGPVLQRLIYPLSAAAILLGLWVVFVSAFDVPSSFFPTPPAVTDAWLSLLSSGRLVDDVLISMQRLLLGSFVGVATGLLAGVVVGLNRSVRIALEPMVNAMSGIAGIAWIPLALAWFGTGLAMSTFVIWNGVFFLVFSNTALGVSRVPVALSQSVRTLGGGRWRTLWSVSLPGAMPDMLNGVRVGLSFGWRTLIAAELLGAPQGLGQMISEAAVYQRSDRIIAGCITIAILGIALERLTVTALASHTIHRWGTVTLAEERGA